MSHEYYVVWLLIDLSSILEKEGETIAWPSELCVVMYGEQHLFMGVVVFFVSWTMLVTKSWQWDWWEYVDICGEKWHVVTSGLTGCTDELKLKTNSYFNSR